MSLKKAFSKLKKLYHHHLPAFHHDSTGSDCDPVQITEQTVEDNLNKLEQTGVLQHANCCLSLKDLLNPEVERQVVEDTADEDTYQAVMASRAAEENILLAGGADDKDDRDNAKVLPRPSRKTALEAAATLERYVGVLEESLAYARRLENLLLSFGHQTRFEETQSMVNTLITDHFHKNNN